MTEQNYENLERQLFYTGFSEVSKEELKNQMATGKEEFQLLHQKEYGTDKVSAHLNIKLSEKGNYYFHSYDLSLKKQGEEHPVSRTFKINYGNTYTLKEAYNMLDGRSVNKDFLPRQKKDENGVFQPLEKDENGRLKTYNAWAYLDMTEKDKDGDFLVKKKFNYDLEEALSKHPIKEMGFDQSRSELIESLKKGNRQMVTTMRDGREEKMYFEAAPRSGSVNIYDSNMKKELLSLAKRPEQSVSEEKKLSKKEGIDNQNSESERSDHKVRKSRAKRVG